MKKNNLIITVLAVFAFFACSCKKEPVPTGVALVPVGLADSVGFVGGTYIPTLSLVLKVGQTDTIKTAVKPSNVADTVTWGSSDPAIAGVDRFGVVSGIAVGTAVITATTVGGNKTATCMVTVSNWVTYDQPNGIVNAIAIDAQGNKWFGIGGLNGVMKFDGVNWTAYGTANSGLAEDYVRAIAIDAQGNIWCGTDNAGVSEFDGANWTTYNVTNSGLGSNHVCAIAVDAQGNKWFGTGAGVTEFDGANWTSRLTGNGVYAIAIDAQGNKWFGTDGGVSVYDGAHWTDYTTLSSGLTYGSVYAVVIDAQGNKWFGTDDGLSKFDGTHWTIYNARRGLFIFGIDFLSIAIDGQGNKWCGSLGVVELYAQ